MTPTSAPPASDIASPDYTPKRINDEYTPKRIETGSLQARVAALREVGEKNIKSYEAFRRKCIALAGLSPDSQASCEYALSTFTNAGPVHRCALNTCHEAAGLLDAFQLKSLGIIEAQQQVIREMFDAGQALLLNAQPTPALNNDLSVVANRKIKGLADAMALAAAALPEENPKREEPPK